LAVGSVVSWASFVASGISGWAKKGVAALGVGVITYAGWGAINGRIETAITGSLGGLPGDVYQLLALGGFIDAVGIWLGALAAAVSLLAARRLGVLSA